MKGFHALLGVLMLTSSTEAISRNLPNIPTHQWLLQTVGDMYAGRPVEDIMERYGAPHSEKRVRGQLVYVWNADTTIDWRRPTEVSTVGSIGDASRYPFKSVPYKEKTTIDSYESVSYKCRLEVYVKDDGIIETLGFFGKMGACAEFNPYK